MGIAVRLGDGHILTFLPSEGDENAELRIEKGKEVLFCLPIAKDSWNALVSGMRMNKKTYGPYKKKGREED